MGGSGGNDAGNSIAVDTSGNVYTTGSFQVTADFDPGAGTYNLTAHAGNNDIFVVKYDAFGNLMWAKSAGESALSISLGMCADASGNVSVTGIFTGSTITFDAITLNHTGGSDIFIVKYDAFGNVIWAKTAQGINEDLGESISTDNAGNTLLTGSFSSPTLNFGTITLTNQGSNDIYVVKFDASGNVVWAKSVGGINDDFGQSISTDASGNVLITGNFISTSLSFGTTTLNNEGVSDIFVAKLDATTLGIDENSNKSSALIYPNPSSAATTIQLKSRINNGQLSMYNVNGQLVKEIKNISGKTITIHRDKLASGVYFINLTDDDKVIISHKIIITD